MNETVKILCVDDEPSVLKSLKRLFMDEDYELFMAESAEEGLAVLEKEWDVQVVISDYRMPGMNGVDFLRAVHEGWPDTIRIVLSGYADTASVVAAINEGQVYRFIPKPWDDEELKVSIDKAIDSYRLRMKNRKLTRDLQASNGELKILNDDLERAVEDRTAELVFQNKVLQLGQNLLDSLPVVVLGLDDMGFIVQCNRIFYDLVGLRAGSIMGKDVTEVLPEDVGEFIGEVAPDQVKAERFSIFGRSCRLKVARVKADDGQQGVVLVIDTDTV